MKILELFKGTGSITKYYENENHEIISLDILEKQARQNLKLHADLLYVVTSWIGIIAFIQKDILI